MNPLDFIDLSTLPAKLLAAGVTVILGLLINSLIKVLLNRYHHRRPITIDDTPINLDLWNGPIRALVPAILLRVVIPSLGFSELVTQNVNHLLLLWIIGAIAWLAQRTLVMVRDILQRRFPVDVEDNLEARRVLTQFRIIERLGTALIIVLAVATMLMTFEGVRQFGVSLLASAGIAGVVIGFAAQQSLGTLFAGIQIAISQPIRLDDVVIVEGEWGKIEEITLTYVVVRIWDERRLILPITYFLDNPIENWTYTTAALLGTVYLYADYTLPVEEVRQELKRILEESDLWDGRAWSLLVTDSSERTMEIRALMSAANSSDSWSLRCQVRERLIAYLQENFPGSLPRLRLEPEAVKA